MNDLDRYVELCFNKDQWGRWTDENEKELQSLYPKIQGLIELGKLKTWNVEKFEEQIKELESQVAKLKEDGHYAFNKSMEWKLKALEYKSTLDKIKTKLNDRQYYLWVEKYDLIADIETIFEDNK